MIAKRTTKNGDVRYDVRLRGPDGRERSKTFRTKKEAERYERAHFAALDAGTWVDPRAGRITLEEWATEWRRTIVHLRPKTVSAYDSNLRNHILPALGHHELARLRPPVLRAWLAELCTKPARGGGLLAPLSVLQAYRTLNRVLAAAVDDELLARNPMSRIEPPRVETKPMRFLTHAEVARLADSIDQRYGPLVLLAAYGGFAPASSSHSDGRTSTSTISASVSSSRCSTSAATSSSRRRRRTPAAARSRSRPSSPTNSPHVALTRTVTSRPACSSQPPGAATSATPTSAGARGRRQ